MAVSTRQEFLDVLARSNLLTDEQLRKAEELAAVTGDPRTVAKRIVQTGWLTRWQAQQLLAGRTKLFLGKYKLLDGLGQGGMGAVFKAEQPGLNRTVALKMMSRDVLGNPDAVERFMREIQLAAALEHPNIVRAFDADRVGGTYFLVMEYVDGDELRAWIRQHGMLPVAWSCEVIRQAALGLQHAHESGLAHRDIKPTNLLVERRETRVQSQTPNSSGSGLSTLDSGLCVKLLDMGLAKFVSETQEEGGLTKTGQIMGTPDYIAPEQAQNTRAADIRSDIFSLGCTLFEMLAGRLPYTGSGLMEKLMARTQRDAPRVRTLRPEVPPELDDVVAKMLARDPGQRFQTPGELSVALAPFSLATMPAVPQTAVLAQPQQHQESKKVEAQADTTLNRFLHELDDRISATPPFSPAPEIQIEETGGRPDSKIQRTPAPIDRRRLTIGGVAAGVLLFGLIWAFAGRGGEETTTKQPEPPVANHDTDTAPPTDGDEAVVENVVKKDETTVEPPPQQEDPVSRPPDPEPEPESLTTVLPNGWVVGAPSIVGPSSGAGGPCLSRDNLTLYFHSSVLGGNGANDLWMCTRKSVDEPFGEPANLGPDVNGPSEDTDACLSADGLTLLCSRWAGNWDLWTFSRPNLDEPWGNGARFAAPINTPESEKGPTLTADGLALIFDTDREGGLGSNDLWMSERVTTDEPFGDPVPLGEAVNSTVNDHDPAISADGLTLLFMSDRSGGTDGTWMCTRPNRDAPFEPAVRLPEGLRGEPFLSFDGRWLMLNSRQAAITKGGSQPEPESGVSPTDLPQSPKLNYALRFDGKTSYVEIPTLKFNNSQPLTIEATMRGGSGIAGENYIITNGTHNPLAPQRVALRHGKGGSDPGSWRFDASARLAVFGASAPSGTTYENSIVRLAGVWDGTRARLFVNGKLVATMEQPTEIDGLPAAGPFRIGAANNKTGEPLYGYIGTIDEVRISNVARYDHDYRPRDRFEPDEHTLALYHFDEGRDRTLTDWSGNGHHGTIHGAAWSARDGSPLPLPGNYALKFDGKTAHVEVPTLRWDDGPMTVEAYFVPAEKPVDASIVQVRGTGEVRLWDQGEPGVGFEVNRLGLATGMDPTPRTIARHHLAGVFDGARLHFYLDGTLIRKRLVRRGADAIDVAGATIAAMRDLNNPEQVVKPFAGLLDELRISKVARYDANFTPDARFEPDADTLALYHFDEAAGNVLVDASGNHHHGQIVGAAWVNADGSPLVAHQLAVAPFDAEQAKQFQERWAEDLGRDVEFTNSIGMKLRLLPPGEFQMGAGPEELQMLLEGKTDPQEIDLVPVKYRRHWVRIARPYYLGALEVTNRQWQQVMFDQTATDDEPKGHIRRQQAAEFCRKLSQAPAEQQAGRRYRLPTEAEWEYACRAGTTTAFYFGDTLTPQQADIQGAGRKPTKPGEFPPNAWGLYDMHGRKWEWCADRYADDYYSRSPVEDPLGPKKSPDGKHVTRGGSAARTSGDAMSASRAAYKDEAALFDFGLRVVCEVDGK